MATRNIKDAKDLNTDELIYFKGHAQATFMSDGRTVEEAVNEMSGGSIDTSNLATKDELAQKQDKLVSGSNIKTVNNISLLGSGNIAINSGEENVQSDWNETDTSSDAYIKNKPTIPSSVTESIVSDWGFTKNTGTVTSVTVNGLSKTPSSGVVDLGYINKQLSTSTSSSMTLSPNIYYRNTSTSLSTLTITLGSVSNSNIINEYFVEFTTSSSGTTVSLPSSIKWANGETPTFEASTIYQISIVNNLGTVLKFK